MATRKWHDYVGPGLAILSALLAILVIAGHLYLASKNALDPLSTLLLNVLALTFSTICTVWVGRWSALRENRAFIRAALRTTYGLNEGLEAAEQVAVDGINRMRGRTGLDSAVSSDFWEEVVGRVVDQVRALMRRAQETVANWKEFGPEEVEQLTDAEEQKATALKEVVIATDQVRSILDDLKVSLGADQTRRLQARIEALEQERERITATSAFALPATGEARRLLAAGALEEAIGAYSSLLSASPDSHTLYIARARARSLAGDKEGALADLDEAERRCHTDPVIPRMRSDISEGRRPNPVTVPPVNAWSEHVIHGNRALSEGLGDDALRHFAKAEEAGLFSVFAVANAAMAMVLGGKYSEAERKLDEALPSITGLFVRSQTFAILAIIEALGGDETTRLTALKNSLEAVRSAGLRFELDQSPLPYLIHGLVKTNRMTDSVKIVVSVLRGDHVENTGARTTIDSFGTPSA